MPEVTQSVYALLGVLFGGAGAQAISIWLQRSEKKELASQAADKIEADIQTKLRDELWTERKELRAENVALQKDANRIPMLEERLRNLSEDYEAEKILRSKAEQDLIKERVEKEAMKELLQRLRPAGRSISSSQGSDEA